MGTEDRELGPFEPAPDMLILAAIDVVIRMAAALSTTPSALVDGITWKPGRVLETDPQNYTLAEGESGEGS